VPKSIVPLVPRTTARGPPPKGNVTHESTVAPSALDPRLSPILISICHFPASAISPEAGKASNRLGVPFRLTADPRGKLRVARAGKTFDSDQAMIGEGHDSQTAFACAITIGSANRRIISLGWGRNASSSPTDSPDSG